MRSSLLRDWQEIASPKHALSAMKGAARNSSMYRALHPGLGEKLLKELLKEPGDFFGGQIQAGVADGQL